MPGIRITHPTLTGVTYAVEHPTKKYRVPYACNRCKRTHLTKTIHLDLDGQGSTIVSAGVLEDLRSIPGMAGLEVANEVLAPPPLVIGDVAVSQLKIIRYGKAG